jgi:hypothetical protein
VRNEIKFHLTLYDVTGSADDSYSSEYVCLLAAAIACDASKGHTKKWARSWLDEIRHQREMVNRLERIPAAIA